MSPAPRRKLRIDVRDLVQARDGIATGRSLAPRARKIVFPVCWGLMLVDAILVGSLDRWID